MQVRKVRRSKARSRRSRKKSPRKSRTYRSHVQVENFSRTATRWKLEFPKLSLPPTGHSLPVVPAIPVTPDGITSFALRCGGFGYVVKHNQDEPIKHKRELAFVSVLIERAENDSNVFNYFPEYAIYQDKIIVQDCVSDLFDFITKGNPDNTQKQLICQQVEEGLSYLHDTVQYAHRDIKMENMLLKPVSEDRIRAVLFDFDGVHNLKAAGWDGNLWIGSLQYRAPYNATQYADDWNHILKQNDWWAWYVCVFAMHYKKFPLYGLDNPTRADIKLSTWTKDSFIDKYPLAVRLFELYETHYKGASFQDLYAEMQAQRFAAAPP